ncbi:MAG: 4Fe-4S binding protein [Candidatus Lokiarchaeota archaeon]
MDSASNSLEKKINELTKISYKAVTNLEKCISCGTCIKFCPLFIRKFNENKKAITVNTHRTCGGCSVCFQRCPQKAIQLIKVKKL